MMELAQPVANARPPRAVSSADDAAHPAVMHVGERGVDPAHPAHAETWRHQVEDLAASRGVDPRLTLEATELDFGRIEVGDVRELTAYVRNDDTRPLSVDRLAAIDDDPFHELEIAQSRTLWLQPGEAASFTLRFEPRRAGPLVRRFGLIGNGASLGPGVELEVRGEGVDREPLAQRIERQHQDADALDASRTNDPLRPHRIRARRAIADWSAKAKALDRHIADWSRDNWQDFLGRTGGSYQMYATDKVVGAIAWTMKNTIKQVARTENAVLSIALKNVIDRFVDFFADQFRDRPPSADDQAAHATRSTAAASIARGHEVDRYRDAADSAVDDAGSGAELAIAKAASAEEIDPWTTWATAQAAALPRLKLDGDRSLRDELLAEWVLQNGVTASSPNAETNPSAWRQARTELALSGKLITTERTDLFVHQCLREWSDLGLVEAEQAAKELDDNRADIELQATTPGTNRAETAAIIASTLTDHVTVFHRIRDPRTFAKVFQSRYTGTDGGDLGDPRKLRGEIFLTCTLRLAAQGRAVVVKEFEYLLNDADGPAVHAPNGDFR